MDATAAKNQQEVTVEKVDWKMSIDEFENNGCLMNCN